jgi:BMFP domain-containing protein YqiC
VAVSVGVGGVRHHRVRGGIIKQTANAIKDPSVAGAHQPGGTECHGLGTFGGVPQDEDRFPQARPLLLDASAVGQYQGGANHETDKVHVRRRLGHKDVRKASHRGRRADVGGDEGGPAAGAEDAVRDQLLEELRDQVAFLRRELEAERNAHAETRRIAYTLAQRVPELEAPQTAPEESEGTEPSDRGQAETPVQRRSWWRRFFGFHDREAG